MIFHPYYFCNQLQIMNRYQRQVECSKDSIAQIHRNLESMKQAASQFLNRGGNSDLPPIIKARHYLFHSLIQDTKQDKKALTLSIFEKESGACQKPDHQYQSEHTLEESLTSRRRQKKKIAKKQMPKTICGLEYEQPAEISVNQEVISKQETTALTFKLSNQKQNKQKSPKINLQVSPKQYKTKVKYGLNQHSVDLDQLFPETANLPRKIRYTSISFHKKHKNPNPQYLTISQTIQKKTKSSLDNYEKVIPNYSLTTTEIKHEKRSTQLEDHYRKYREKEIQPLKGYFEVMKESRLTGSLQLQQNIQKCSQEKRKPYLRDCKQLSKKTSLDIDRSEPYFDEKLGSTMKEMKSTEKVQKSKWRRKLNDNFNDYSPWESERNQDIEELFKVDNERY